MNEMSKVVHMKKKFTHGWYAACGREITSNTAIVFSWPEVTCKNCKLKQWSSSGSTEYSGLLASITSESIERYQDVY